MGLLNRHSNEPVAPSTTVTGIPDDPARVQVSNGPHHHGHHANGMPPAQEPYGANTAPNGMNGGYGGSNGHSNPYANGNAPVGADTGYGGQYKTHAVNDVALAEADNRHHHHHQQNHSAPAGANGYDAAPAGGPVGLGAGEGTYTRGPGPHSPQNNTGTGTGIGTTGMDNTSAGGVGGAPIAQTEREAAKLQRKGKMEHVLGSITCSSNLQHKGDLHKAQAGQLKMQAQELGEAERLEHEAGMRRHRAVGLGADPVHANGATGLGQGRTGTAQAGY